MRRTIRVIDRLRTRPSGLEDAVETMNMAAEEIDRLLTAITNAQAALTYEGMSPEERINAALGSLSFADH